VILETVLFNFPPELPVDGTNMNYCVVAFAIVLVISLIQWFIDGRKNFKGPVVDLGEMLGAVPEHQRNEMLQQSEILQAEQIKSHEEHSSFSEVGGGHKNVDAKL
jgi:choline transport protein